MLEGSIYSGLRYSPQQGRVLATSDGAFNQLRGVLTDFDSSFLWRIERSKENPGARGCVFVDVSVTFLTVDSVMRCRAAVVYVCASFVMSM